MKTDGPWNSEIIRHESRETMIISVGNVQNSIEGRIRWISVGRVRNHAFVSIMLADTWLV